MKFLINERLSEHKTKTPEGYLICLDAILARTGKQTYKKNEIFVDSDDDTEIEVDRTEDEVFSPQTLASFENKPITVEHPDEDVNVHNYKEYAVGFVRDVRRGEVNGEPVILGNLVITDEQTIQEIENGEHTDLSCGYDCDIVDQEHPCQKNIRGNHVALCEQGRAGIARIVDSVKDETLYQVVAYEHGDWAGVGKSALTGETFWVKTTNKEDAIRKVRAKKPNADKYEATIVDPSFISETKINFMKNRGRFIDSTKDTKVLEVGKKVKIKSPSSWANGEWGVIKGIDGDDYFVAIANDPHQALLFAKEELKLIDSIEDAMETYYFTWVDTYTKSKGYDSSFWRFKDEVKANSLNEALKKLEYIVVMRGVGTANCLVMHVSTPRTTYQFSGRLSDLLKKNFDDSIGDGIKKQAEDKLGRKFILEEQADGTIVAKNESGREKIFKNWQEAREEFSKRSITIFDDDKFNKATEQAYRALKLGAMNSEAVIQELKRTFGLSYDDAKRAFMSAHVKYELEDSIQDVEPREDESKDEFIARFMKETEGEYPDEKQRLAVAYSYWNKKDSVKDADKYRIGQQVRYHGKPTKILKIEYDPRYGYDLLIENPEWDGKNEKLKNVWVGENVDDSVKDALIDPPQDIINDFERQLKSNGVIITATGRTMILGRKHYQVKYYGSGRELNDIFKRIDQYMRSKNIPMTWSIASDTENDICTAGIDLDKMYVKDSSKKMEKVQKIVKAIKKIK